MSDKDERFRLEETPVEEIREMKIGTDAVKREPDTAAGTPELAQDAASLRRPNGTLTGGSFYNTSASQSPSKKSGTPRSPAVKSEKEELVGGDITVKQEPGQAPKLARSSSRKIVTGPPKIFSGERDATGEASSSYETITNCIYANKYLGATEHALECDCAEEWDSSTSTNLACGDDSDCINRATKMECVGDCGCGTACQNQRFQRQSWARVAVFKTEKKGYGLRAEFDMQPNEFIYEYIGEVIGESVFQRRMVQYDQEGIKHFYFMSLNKGEFVDATKKGNLGRFCNHSCNPNCYVDKWVVGDKLRMGIFAERKIHAGEELVFNYNVDRYGANPQPCYCGEPNCTGYIGGKTQTERGTKLSAATIEALGIDDAEAWDTAVARKPKKKKTSEDDEEYVDSVQPRSLDESGVTKVMATLMQCKEKWIAVKLLSRIQRCDEDRVRHRVVRMHGYQILNTTLSTWIEDENVVLQVIDILYKLPRLTRNKIQDSKIESTVERLVENDSEQVREKASGILKVWASLEMGYRIPRLKRDPAAVAAAEKAEREERRRAMRERSRSRSRSKSNSPERSKNVPTGPRNSAPQRTFPARPSFRRPPPPLPAGWSSATSAEGKTYYYSATGQTQWTRPTVAANQPPPPPPKAVTDQQRLQDIINGIINTPTPTDSKQLTPKPSSTPTDSPAPLPEKKEQKWRSWGEDKQRKVYENTISPHIIHVMNKFKGKLPKEDLKRFAKELSKKFVSSDFKNNTVTDPTFCSSKKETEIKKHTKEFFKRAIEKKAAHDKRKREKLQNGHGGREASVSAVTGGATNGDGSPDVKMDESIAMSESEDESERVSDDTGDLKRKREADETPLTGISPDESDIQTPTLKKHRSTDSAAQLDFMAAAPPPPPPPPPPGEPPQEEEGLDEESTPVDISGNNMTSIIQES